MGKVTTLYLDREVYNYLKEYYRRSLSTLIDDFLYVINYDDSVLLKVVKEINRKGDDKVTVSIPRILHRYLKTFSAKYGFDISVVVNSILNFIDYHGFIPPE